MHLLKKKKKVWHTLDNEDAHFALKWERKGEISLFPKASSCCLTQLPHWVSLLGMSHTSLPWWVPKIQFVQESQLMAAL